MGELLLRVPAWAALLLGAVVVLGEPAVLLGVVLPSLTSMLVLGFLAANDVVPVALAVVVAFLAAVAGDTTGFLLGRRLGRPDHTSSTWWLRRLPGRVRRTVIHGVHDAEARITRSTGIAVAGARWVGVVRTLVPRMAGHGGVRLGRFLAFEVPSALAWACFAVGAGYLAGRSYAVVGNSVAVVTAVVVVGLLGWLLVRRHRARPEHT